MRSRATLRAVVKRKACQLRTAECAPWVKLLPRNRIVRGAAARRLTGLFYEARFSTHPLGRAERDAASAALDELAAELGAGAEVTT